MGVKALSKIQLGKETTAGTAVAATAVWRGLGTGRPVPTIVHPPEDIGNLMGYDRTYIPHTETQIELPAVPASFEQAPYIFEAGIELETPSQDGAGTDYIYTYNYPTTAQRTLRTYTIEYGDDIQEREAPYCFVPKFTLAGKVREALTMQASWLGRESSKSTFTSLTPATVETVLFQLGKIYIDGAATFPATTQKTITWKAFELASTTGHTAQDYGDGRLDFVNTKQVMPEVILKVTYEHNATSVAELDAMLAQTTRSIRLDFTGSAVGTPGTTYSAKHLIIDLLGKYEEFGPFEDMDGDNVMVATLRCRFNSTANHSGRIIVVNELSALT